MARPRRHQQWRWWWRPGRVEQQLPHRSRRCRHPHSAARRRRVQPSLHHRPLTQTAQQQTSSLWEWQQRRWRQRGLRRSRSVSMRVRRTATASQRGTASCHMVRSTLILVPRLGWLAASWACKHACEQCFRPCLVPLIQPARLHSCRRGGAAARAAPAGRGEAACGPPVWVHYQVGRLGWLAIPVMRSGL